LRPASGLRRHPAVNADVDAASASGASRCDRSVACNRTWAPVFALMSATASVCASRDAIVTAQPFSLLADYQAEWRAEV
jgi:hypothetical protein